MSKKYNKIYNGDFLKIGDEILEEGEVDLVVTDPPYNASNANLKLVGNKTGGDFYAMNEDWDKMTESEYMKFSKNWISKCSRYLKNNGSIYVCATFHNLGEILISLKELDLETKNILVWKKTNAMPNITKRTFTHSTEFIVWAVKGSNWIFNYEKMKEINPKTRKDGKPKQMRDVWEFPLCQGKERLKDEDNKPLHPNQKPEKLIERPILASSKPGDLILDPMVGVGTTAVVAEKYNRKWIGIDKNDEYVKAARERIENLEENKREKTKQTKIPSV